MAELIRNLTTPMFECFLNTDASVVLDKDKNIIYMLSSLNKTTIDIKDKEGKFLPIGNLLSTMPGVVEKMWEKEEWYGALAGAIQLGCGLVTIPPVIFAFNAGFGLGMIFERVRSRKDLTISVLTEPMGSAEADSIMAQFKKETVDGEPDEPAE